MRRTIACLDQIQFKTYFKNTECTRHLHGNSARGQDTSILTLKKKYHEIIFSSELRAESGLMFVIQKQPFVQKVIKRSFLSARAKRNSDISSISISQNFVQVGDDSWVLSESCQWDIGLKIKYLSALNDLSFTGNKIETSGPEIVDKQSNSFHLWRLGN